MGWFFTALVTGITSFIATNIDDIALLILFFSQVSDRLRPRHIILGQYLGFTIIIFASLVGFFGGLLIPKTWIGLLGFVPIAMGIKHFIAPEEDEEEIHLVSSEQNPQTQSNSIRAFIKNIMKFPPYYVASVTVANGGDNIGIYVPLFASSNLESFLVILCIFYILIAVWCGIAYSLIRQPMLAQFLKHHSKTLVPFVLIALGIYILVENESYQLFIPR